MSIANELQDKINAKAAIKTAIETKGVTVGDIKLNQYAAKIDAIAQDPSIPVGTGQWLITWWDYDGKVLKRQRVNTGENATAPAIPTHQYLTFAEWNNPFTNVQSDIDTGAIYNTTDGKTYLFITLTPVTGLAPTLFFSKSSASLMTIDWGDGTTSTSTTSGNQSIQHTYAAAGDYIITVDNSAGGTWTAGQGSVNDKLFQGYENCLIKLLIGSNILLAPNCFRSNAMLTTAQIGNSSINTYVFHSCSSLKHLTVGTPNINFLYFNVACYSLKRIVLKNTTTTIVNPAEAAHALNKIILPSSLLSIPSYSIYNNQTLKAVYCGANILSIGSVAFGNNYLCEQYIFTSLTPPTLANINAFIGINPICKIYVPDASVEAYKAATNWNNYAKYIYPLSQKPQSDE